MGKSKSMRGQVVDFDLLQMKSKISKKDTPADVKLREKFIHSKRKRNSKKAMARLREDQEKNAEQVRNALNAKIASDQESDKTESTDNGEEAGGATPKSGKKIIKKKS